MSEDRADVTVIDVAGERVEVLRTVYRAMTFPRHTHDFHTIGVGLRGVGSIWYRGTSHVRRYGDVVVIPPGEVHTGGVGPRSEELSYLAACVPARLIERCAAAAGLRSTTLDVRSPIITDPVVQGTLLALVRSMDSPVASPGEALSIALSTLLRRHGGPCTSRASMDATAIVHTTREILETCYADSTRTSLDALASATGVTGFHVIRAFTRATGLSPHHFLVQVRVQRARSLLAAGTAPSIVAAMTGFADQSHLTAQFKRYVGITPGRYQRCLGV